MDTSKSSQELGGSGHRNAFRLPKHPSGFWLSPTPKRKNVQRTDVYPFEEAQGFRALLEREGSDYSIQKIAARVGKTAAHVAKRLKLLDLIQPVADAFTAGRIGLRAFAPHRQADA
jgi:hypothetical protein